MNSSNGLSDIEKILQGQTWKIKRLPSLSNVKRPIKIRSATEKEKPRKQERITTQPCVVPQEESLTKASPPHLGFLFNTKPENPFKMNESNRHLSCLAVPFNIVSQAVTSVAAKSHSFDFHVPVFPKRGFGGSYKDSVSTPKFECVKIGFPDEEIKRLKVESGRISQNSQRKSKIKFPFLEDFHQLGQENTVKTERAIYKVKHFN